MTKHATENADKWDKILEETRGDRIPGTDREATWDWGKRSMSFSVMRWKEKKTKERFLRWGGK